MGQSSGATPGKKTGNIYNQASTGLSNASKATQTAGQGFLNLYQNPAVPGSGAASRWLDQARGELTPGGTEYNPALQGGAGLSYNPSLQGGAGMSYNPSLQGGAGMSYNPSLQGRAGMSYDPSLQGTRGLEYDAAMQAGPASIASGIDTYMNPYTNEVINRNAEDIRRQTQTGIRDLGSTAAGAGAFGGSRHGLAEGTAVAEGSRALGDISANLRQAGFNTASQLAGQDIANRMQVSAANQAAENAARQFGATSWQAREAANAAAKTRAAEFGATSEQARAAANAAAKTRAAEFGATSQQAREAANAAAKTAAAQFGATSEQARAAANAAAKTRAAEFGATSQQARAAADAAAKNRAGEFNATAQMQRAQQLAALAQQKTGMGQDVIANRLAALQGLQGAGAQGAQLTDQALGIAGGMTGAQSSYGEQVRNIPQSLMSQAAGMFDRYTGQPLDSTAAILNLLSGNPLSGTGKTTQTNTPGTKSLLGGALGLAGRV